MRINNLSTDLETKVISHFDKIALLDGLDKYLRSMGLKKKKRKEKGGRKQRQLFKGVFYKENGAEDGGMRNKAKKIMFNLLFP